VSSFLAKVLLLCFALLFFRTVLRTDQLLPSTLLWDAPSKAEEDNWKKNAYVSPSSKIDNFPETTLVNNPAQRSFRFIDS
jgi:hypothetical protein